MVIDTNNNINSGGPVGTRSRNATPIAAPETKASVAPAGSVKTTDNVVLSQEAQSLNRLQASINQASDVDIERVEALKQAIADGRFEFNAERIAENMLKQEELLG